MKNLFFYAALILFGIACTNLGILIIGNYIKPIETWEWVITIIKIVLFSMLVIINKNQK